MLDETLRADRRRRKGTRRRSVILAEIVDNSVTAEPEPISENLRRVVHFALGLAKIRPAMGNHRPMRLAALVERPIGNRHARIDHDIPNDKENRWQQFRLLSSRSLPFAGDSSNTKASMRVWRQGQVVAERGPGCDGLQMARKGPQSGIGRSACQHMAIIRRPDTVAGVRQSCRPTWPDCADSEYEDTSTSTRSASSVRASRQSLAGNHRAA